MMSAKPSQDEVRFEGMADQVMSGDEGEKDVRLNEGRSEPRAASRSKELGV